MKFYYNGTKKSNDIGFGSGCVLLIGFAALIYFFTLIDGIEDLKEYWIEIGIVSLMGISLTIALFGKKGELSNRHVVIENDYLKLDKVSVPLSTIRLDVYLKESKFRRYHLRDTEGKLTIYSVFEDDLYRHILENYPEQTSKFQEESSKQDGPYVSILAESQSLYYDLDSGKYTIKENKENTLSHLPEIYTYDGKYKKGAPLIKNKS